MRAIKIDAEKREIYEIEINEKDSLEQMQSVVGGYIELCLHLADGDAIFVNEEGLLQSPENKQHWILYEGHPQPWVGNAIVCGSNRNGDTRSVKTSCEDLRKVISFLSLDDVRVALAFGKFA